jgi:hypothetical protein
MRLRQPSRCRTWTGAGMAVRTGRLRPLVLSECHPLLVPAVSGDDVHVAHLSPPLTRSAADQDGSVTLPHVALRSHSEGGSMGT